jgi:hypothetical protein
MNPGVFSSADCDTIAASAGFVLDTPESAKCNEVRIEPDACSEKGLEDDVGWASAFARGDDAVASVSAMAFPGSGDFNIGGCEVSMFEARAFGERLCKCS